MSKLLNYPSVVSVCIVVNCAGAAALFGHGYYSLSGAVAGLVVVVVLTDVMVALERIEGKGKGNG